MSEPFDSFPLRAPPFNGQCRAVPAGSAFEWLRQGWLLFIAYPALWIALTVILIVLMLGLSIVPFIGSLAANLLLPVLAAGVMRVCQKIFDGRMPVLSDLFDGFNKNSGNLVLLGLLYMLGMLILFAVVASLAAGGLAGSALAGQPPALGIFFGKMLFALLVWLILSVPLVMAIWFAPALVLFNNMPPLAALKASFNACLKNVLPFFVYGLIVMVLSFFAALPVGLGFLVLVPVLSGSVYASYRDIFVAN